MTEMNQVPAQNALVADAQQSTSMTEVCNVPTSHNPELKFLSRGPGVNQGLSGGGGVDPRNPCLGKACFKNILVFNQCLDSLII
jgi:hypothetical protein